MSEGIPDIPKHSLVCFGALALLRFYRQYLSAFVGGGCHFRPSCSAYAQGCFAQHGAWLGLRLTWRRLSRCRHAVGPGEDPVPARGEITIALRGGLVVFSP